MTREEKISHLKGILSEINENDNAVCYLTSEDNELIKSAIEALEQESCEDTISRKDALKALDYDIKSFEFKSGVGRHMNEIADLLNTIYEIQSDNIKALPPVQPKYNPDEWCKTCSEYSQDKHCCPRYNNVIRNAVEEMKQSCEDCISREQAIKQCGFGMTSLLIADNLRRLPPVHPKIKTGHWIESDNGNMISRHRWYCSECGGMHHDTETGEWREVFDFRYAYCPLCGARMIEPQESEGSMSEISETKMHHLICAFCDNPKCVRGTEKCEFEQWKRQHVESEVQDADRG